MANIVNQPSVNPTNKLSAAVVGAAVVEVARALLNHFAPDFAQPELWTALTPVIIFFCGWFVPDAPNVVVITQGAQQ
jgi:hypothetical protein